MDSNPWDVENIQEFSFLNCPECSFKTKEDNMFQNHAVTNHPLSSILFNSKSDELIDDIITEDTDLEKVKNSRKTNRKIKCAKKSSEKSKIPISGVIEQILSDLTICQWENKGNQIPFQTLFTKFPIKVSDLPTEVPNGNKSNKSFLIQVKKTWF